MKQKKLTVVAIAFVVVIVVVVNEYNFGNNLEMSARLCCGLLVQRRCLVDVIGWRRPSVEFSHER